MADPALLDAPELYFNAATLDRSVAVRTTDWVAVAQPGLHRPTPGTSTGFVVPVLADRVAQCSPPRSSRS